MSGRIDFIRIYMPLLASNKRRFIFGPCLERETSVECGNMDPFCVRCVLDWLSICCFYRSIAKVTVLRTGHVKISYNAITS